MVHRGKHCWTGNVGTALDDILHLINGRVKLYLRKFGELFRFILSDQFVISALSLSLVSCSILAAYSNIILAAPSCGYTEVYVMLTSPEESHRPVTGAFEETINN